MAPQAGVAYQEVTRAMAPQNDDVIVLTLRGSDEPALYACPTCRKVNSPGIYLCPKDDAHRAAIDAARKCCQQWQCEDCGAETRQFWTVCPPCREKRKLRKAKRIAWDGECMVCYHDDQYTADVAELAELEDPPAYCHPCEFEPFRLSLQSMIESAADQHHDDIADEIDGAELMAVEEAIASFNESTGAGSWTPIFDSVIVLDEERFAALIA